MDVVREDMQRIGVTKEAKNRRRWRQLIHDGNH